MSNACRQKCTPAQVCNPASTRCVKRDGVVGKRVLAAAGGSRAAATNPPTASNSPANMARRYASETPAGKAKITRWFTAHKLGHPRDYSGGAAPSGGAAAPTRVHHSAQNTTVRTRVNAAGKRVAQAVPAGPYGRKAPMGHAKNYKNQVHVGIDGKQWVSQVISTGAYRWKPYKV